MSLIFANLSPSEVAKKAAVCKQWRVASQDLGLWEQITQNCLTEETSFKEVNNLALKFICQRTNADRDEVTAQLICRTKKAQECMMLSQAYRKYLNEFQAAAPRDFQSL